MQGPGNVKQVVPCHAMPAGARGLPPRAQVRPTHELAHRLMGEAPHLMDPEELDAALLPEDGRPRGLYECACLAPGRATAQMHASRR